MLITKEAGEDKKEENPAHPIKKQLHLLQKSKIIMTKALYIGAGLDVGRWLERLPEVETFICIDSLPNSAYGVKLCGLPREDFLHDLVQEMTAHSMHAVPSRNPSSSLRRLEFVNPSRQQRVIYYVNTSYPEHLSLCNANDLDGFTYWIVAGHDPGGSDVLKPPQQQPPSMIFVGTTGTVYGASAEYESPSLFRCMPSIGPLFFKEYRMYDDDAASLYSLPQTASSWEGFLALET